MKKLLLALAVSGLMVGCAAHNSGRGGTSDSEFNNNASYGTGTSTATNRAPSGNWNYNSRDTNNDMAK